PLVGLNRADRTPAVRDWIEAPRDRAAALRRAHPSGDLQAPIGILPPGVAQPTQLRMLPSAAQLAPRWRRAFADILRPLRAAAPPAPVHVVRAPPEDARGAATRLSRIARRSY